MHDIIKLNQLISSADTDWNSFTHICLVQIEICILTIVHIWIEKALISMEPCALVEIEYTFSDSKALTSYEPYGEFSSDLCDGR